MTSISDTVLYAQSCKIDITIFERYVELSIISIEMIVESMTFLLSQQVERCTIDTKWELGQSPVERPQSPVRNLQRCTAPQNRFKIAVQLNYSCLAAF